MKTSGFKIFLSISIFCLGCFASCKKKDPNIATPDKNCYPSVAFTSIEDDLILGARVDSQILATPSQFPILDPAKHTAAYGHLQRITEAIKNSGKVANKDKLAWQLRIIHDDATLNAFVTPGGYIYVYTGLIKYLDSEDDFAGVMGHEVAHADLRHAAKSMTQNYTLETLVAIVSGQGGTAAQLGPLAAQLASLSYSRCYETQADENSVGYLQATSYKCNGAAGFFEKIVAAGGGSGTPQFLSTHPDPGNRVAAIKARAASFGCNTTTPNPNAQYAAFKASLP